MNPDRWRRIEELYHAALERASGERAVFLDTACQDDSELRKEVETLLEQKSGSLLDGPAWEQMPSLVGVPTLTPGTQLGPYIIISAVGSGGMGDVYKAKDPRVDRDVAVKVSNERFSDRFSREAHAVAALNHPNICHLYDVGPDYLVMELVEGPTLAERIKKGPVPLKEALAIAKQIAEALEAAHEKGIVHRDLKPANIKLTADGNVKVLDFGLAKRQEPVMGNPEDSPTITSTQEGVILGTAAYMSPEQASGKPVDKRSDIWAFGVVLWELLTGRRLFKGDTVTQTLAGVLNSEIDFDQLPGETPVVIRGLLRRCLDRDVKTRLRDIGEARIVIDTAFEPMEPAVLPPRSRSPSAWIATAAAFALLFGALAFVYFRELPSQRQRIKFQINPPKGDPGEFGLSPDGRFLGIGTLEGTQVKVWLRPLDSLDARLVIERQYGDHFIAFWSWDGENSAFQSGGQLFKISRSGGTPTLLADVPQPISGAVWLDSGVIVFGTESGLFRVSSSGGAPVKIGDQFMHLPSWLPGRRFLYLSEKDGLFAGSLDGAKPTQILPDHSVSTGDGRSGPVYVPASKPGLPGYLLFLRRETLCAQLFKADKLELQGEVIPIEERVSEFTASMNGVLAFQRANSPDRVLTWVDRAGKRLRSVSKPFRPDGDPAIRLSPNDAQAIVPIDGGDGPDLWIADLNRNTLSKFTFNGSWSGIWSPDGRKVLWAANDGNRYLRSADGSGKDELLFKDPTCLQAVCYVLDWSSDGRFITFSGLRKVDKKQVIDIWIVPTESDRKPHPYLQSLFDTYWAQISPDNRWIAYGSSDRSLSTRIFVESIPAGKRRWQVSTETGDWPIWSRDGKELFYRDGIKLMAVPTRLTETSVEIGNPVELFKVPSDGRFQVSRDGQRFLVALPAEGDSDIRQFTIDTDWRAGLK